MFGGISRMRALYRIVPLRARLGLGWIGRIGRIGRIGPIRIRPGLNLALALALFAGAPAAAQIDLAPRTEATPVSEMIRYERVALLMPWSSLNASAAQAFHDGFNAARSTDSWRPEVLLYDIGADPDLVSIYYKAALRDGADFVIGPLGQRAALALLATRPSHPTMVIGRIPADQAQPWLFGLGLSLQNQARVLAERMYAAGHRRVGVVRKNADWAERLAADFARHWTALGGELVLREIIAEAGAQAEQIKAMLHLEQSRHRHGVLARMLDRSLSFTPRRRQDLSALFLATDAGQAREWVPQLRFHQGHDLALYATSRMYGGHPDVLRDADLEGVEFCDLPWLLRPDALDPEVPIRPDDPFDFYRNSPLERLFVLGYAGFKVIPELAWMRGREGSRHRSGLLDVNLPEDGNLVPSLTCAVFRNGRPAPRIGR